MSFYNFSKVLDSYFRDHGFIFEFLETLLSFAIRSTYVLSVASELKLESVSFSKIFQKSFFTVTAGHPGYPSFVLFWHSRKRY